MRRPEEFEWLPHALEALHLAAVAGWTAVVVTNQAGVGRGVHTQADLDLVHRRMSEQAAAAGGAIAAVYACPHTPEDRCACRKPQPGLLLAAAADLHLDLASSWLIGDSEVDLAAAACVGVRRVLVRTGRGLITEADRPGLPPDAVCSDVLAAVRRIGPCPRA